MRGRHPHLGTFLFAAALLLACTGIGIGSANADSNDEVGSQFSVDGNTYTITALANGSGAGTVRLAGIDRNASTLTVPSTVSSPTSGSSYTVSAVSFAAFSNDTGLTAVTLPSSVTEILSSTNGSFFYNCSSLESIEVSGDDEDSALQSEDGVLYATCNGEKATLLAYPRQKETKSFAVPESVSTIAPYAFAFNEHLVQIEFQSALTGESDMSTNTLFRGGICTSAFEGCTALETLSFPHGSAIGTVLSSASAAIGSSAFKDCTSLKSLTIPAIVSADQKATAYRTFAELNPNSNLGVGTDQDFTSGYAPYWHNGNGPIARPGIGDGAFSGCTSLESLTFEAGNSTGALAYWVSGGDIFSGCSSLTTLVYEGAQAYWGNPNTSMQNGSLTDIWSSDRNNISAPTYFYAVDYYTTQDAAESADAAGSTRLARVEYKRGTSTSAIATSSSSLSDQAADRSLYAQTDADGVIPDPDEAAAQAGLSGTGWIWKLDGTQSRRSGLSESCHAYLVKKDDLSAGRMDSTQNDALYLQADRNLSQGTSLCPESAFDVTRYGTDGNYIFTPLSGETSPYFTYNPTTGELDTGFQVIAADGTALESSQYETKFQRYDASGKSLKDVSSITSGGAYLVTITPTEASGYEGTLGEWILVQSRTGNLVEAFGKTLTATEQAAKYPYSQTTSIDYSSAPYAVTVGTKDVCGALVASSYAGLVKGAINVDTGQTAKKFGFELNRSTYPNGSIRDASQTRKFTRTTAASAFAVAVYEHFRDSSNRSTYGIASAEYNLGDTAVLVPLGHVSDLASVSAYLYGAKAPVFFTELDGSCSKATRNALKSFAHVKVVGNAKLYSKAAFSKLRKQLGSDTELERLGATATTSGGLSLAIADELVKTGDAAYTSASVSNAANPMDCILALNFTGHEGGITLVTGSTAQSKQIMQRLHENISGLSLVQLYGRAKNNAAIVSSKAYSKGNAFASIWDSDEDFQETLDGIVTTVRDAEFSMKTVDPDHEPAKKDKKNKTAAKTKRRSSTGTGGTTKGGSTNSGTSADVEPPGSLDIDDSDGSSDSPDGTRSASKTKASAGTTSPVAQASAATDQDDSANVATTGDTTPLWQKLVFVAVLLVLCGALIPILRKCR